MFAHRFGGTADGFGIEAVGIGKRGFLARHCTHAHALIDLEAARFHHALFEMPALKSSALAINISIIHLAAANQAQALRQHLGR